jgi:ABC-type Fe3+ transport system substrate-binding protein
MSKTKWYALGLIIIIGVSAFAIWWVIIPKPTPGGELRIITRHDPTLQLQIEQTFLNSEYATNYSITSIAWTQPNVLFWPSVIPTFKPDIAFGGGPTLFNTLYGQGLIETLTSDKMLTAIDRINDTIAGVETKGTNDGGDFIWVGSAISTFGITINKPWLDTRGLPYPTHWENLTTDVFGQFLPATPTIAMGNSPGTTSNSRIYEIILQRFGWEGGWEVLTRMAGNSRIEAGSTETQSQVENGVTGVAMSIDFYGFSTAIRNPDCEYIIPVNGSIINPDPIAICTTTTNKPAAEAFLDFILTPEGQSLWLDETVNRLPIMEEAFHTPLGETRDDLYTSYNNSINNIGIEFSDEVAESYEYSMMYYFESVLTNAHSDLISCWTKLVNAYRTATINKAEFEAFAAQMAAPMEWDSETFTEAYAVSINSNMASSASFRAVLQTKWTDAAIQQYNDVEALIP